VVGCGRRGEGALTAAIAIAVVIVAGVVDDLTGCLPVVALMATLVVHQCSRATPKNVEVL